MNELQQYYEAQAGTGLAGFRGVRFQKGGNFFGRLLSGTVFPLLRFLGKSALKTGANVATDLLDSNDFSLSNLKNITKTRAKESARDAFEKGFTKMKGSGRRRKRKSRKVMKKSIKDCLKLKKTSRKRQSNLLF